MALFKVFRGQRNDLDSITKVDGHAYFCTDDGTFWVDHQETDEIVRTQINKADWNKDINNAIENLLNSNQIVVNAEITSTKSPFLISKIDENGSRRATMVIGEKGRKDGKDFYKLGLQAEAVALQTYTVNEDGSKTSGPGISASSLTNQISILGNAKFESAPWIMAEPIDDYHAVNKAYVDDKIGSAIASVYRYKGVKTYAELLLITDKTIGDVYEVTDEVIVNGKIYPAGTNFAWNGTEWDPLGGSLAGYVTEDKLNTTLENYVVRDGANDLTGSLHFDNYNALHKSHISADGIAVERNNNNESVQTAILDQEQLTFNLDELNGNTYSTYYNQHGFIINNSDGTADLSVDTGLSFDLGNSYTSYASTLIRSEIDGYESELLFPSDYTDYCFQSNSPINLAGHIRVYEDSVEKENGIYVDYDFEKIRYHCNNTDYYISFPEKDGTIATQEWVKANTICSSTIDQEFFNSLY